MKEVQNMLKDQLLEYCQDALIDSNAGHCDCSCNNKEYCYHDCQQCLDQVHWHSSSEGRSDYNCPWLLLTYILHFTERYSQQITDALDLVDINRYPYYNIFSIGCGAAPDLMAFEELVQNSDKTVYYKGYDRNPLWEPIHDYIENYTNGTPNITAKLRREDIFDVFADGKPAHQRYNIVVLEYLLSHFYNDGQNTHIHQLFQYIIDNIISNKPDNSPFLIIIADIDSCWKGRDQWHDLLDMLEDAGYHGTAYAHSAYPTGDLGATRWSSRTHESSPSYGNISYHYFNSDSKAAQLIIELE